MSPAVSPGLGLGEHEGAFIEIAISLTARLDVRQRCAIVLDAAETLYRARSSWILLRDPATDMLVPEVFRGPGADLYDGVRIPCAGGSVAAVVFRGREPLFIPDVRVEQRWFDPVRVRRAGLRSVFLVPLVHEDVAMGVLGLDSDLFTASPPQSRDVARCRALAALAAIGIRNAQMFAALERDRQRLRGEFRRVAERAAVLASEPPTPHVLQAHRPAPQPEHAEDPSAPSPARVVPFLEAERRAIVRALELTGWRISGPAGAARALGLKPTTLHAKMKKLGIRRPGRE